MMLGQLVVWVLCLWRKNGNAMAVLVLEDEKSMIQHCKYCMSIIVYKYSAQAHTAMYSTGAVWRLVHISMQKAYSVPAFAWE